MAATKQDPAADLARRMASRLSWLADAIEKRNQGRTGLGSDEATAAARKRVTDAYEAAWPLLNGAATPREKSRIVRQAVLLAGEPPLIGTLDGNVRVTVQSIGRDCPELVGALKANVDMVRAAIVACGQRPGRGAKVALTSEQAMKNLLKALGLPSARSSWMGREPSGRAWPGVQKKRGPRKPRK